LKTSLTPEVIRELRSTLMVLRLPWMLGTDSRGHRNNAAVIEFGGRYVADDLRDDDADAITQFINHAEALLDAAEKWMQVKANGTDFPPRRCARADCSGWTFDESRWCEDCR
jgi:hypothetical protein